METLISLLILDVSLFFLYVRLHLQHPLRHGSEHYLPGIPLAQMDGGDRGVLRLLRAAPLLRRLPRRGTVPVIRAGKRKRTRYDKFLMFFIK